MPAAAADFDGPNTLGRVNGWVSGEFDFEVIRPSDETDVFLRQVKVSSIDQLEGAYADFLRSMAGAALNDDTLQSHRIDPIVPSKFAPDHALDALYKQAVATAKQYGWNCPTRREFEERYKQEIAAKRNQ